MGEVSVTSASQIFGVIMEYLESCNTTERRTLLSLFYEDAIGKMPSGTYTV